MLLGAKYFGRMIILKFRIFCIFRPIHRTKALKMTTSTLRIQYFETLLFTKSMGKKYVNFLALSTPT